MVCLLDHHNYFDSDSFRYTEGSGSKNLLVVVAMYLFVVSLQSLVRRQWMEEQSLVTSGQLCVFRLKGVCYTSPIPIIEIGDSGTSFVYLGEPDKVDMLAYTEPPLRGLYHSLGRCPD